MGGKPASRRGFASKALGPNVLGPVIASGAVSTVYLARDQQGRSLAVKVLQPSADPKSRQKKLQAWKHQVQISKRLVNIPGVIPIRNYDLRESTPDPYVGAQFVSGETLRETINANHDGATAMGMDVLQALQLFSCLAHSVDAIHRAGVAHCDIKPSNVMISSGGDVFLMGFGSALAEETELTDTAGHAGTVAYMAPELITRRNRTSTRVRKQADLYALGVLLFEMLDGATPLHRAQVSSPADSIAFQRHTGLHGDNSSEFLDRLPEIARPVVEAATDANPYKRPSAFDLALWADDLIGQLSNPERLAGTRSRTRRKVLEWTRRYLPLEIAGTLSAVVVGFSTYKATGNVVSGAFAASLAEAIGYFVCALVLEVRRQTRHADLNDKATSIVLRTTRGLLFEFGPAELVDDLIVRPALIYLATQTLGSFLAGLIAGKLLADIIYYGITIAAYEARKVLWSDTYTEVNEA